jgi:hypothetical protein
MIFVSISHQYQWVIPLMRNTGIPYPQWRFKVLLWYIVLLISQAWFCGKWYLLIVNGLTNTLWLEIQLCREVALLHRAQIREAILGIP